MPASFDIAVIGSGVFGAWTALHLRRAGHRVALVDAWGAGNSRSSSGDESRIIRICYGPDELYARWAQRALERWQEFFCDLPPGTAPLFHPTGVLWLGEERDHYTAAGFEVARKLGIAVERLSHETLERRWPQMMLRDIAWGMLETDSGVLMARRATQAVAQRAIEEGVTFLDAAALTPEPNHKLATLALNNGERLSAGVFVFACGAWLAKLFHAPIGNRIFPTRQEVFYFGTPPGDRRFSPPALPTWLHHAADIYGMPSLDGRGLKCSIDRHGPSFDPDSDSRLPSEDAVRSTREYLGRRFPALRTAPLVEARVCQYENTSNGDFLIDRHPQYENVWIAGGGSGHGFKHGPVVGEYVAAQIAGKASPEPRFLLASKKEVQARAVY